MWRKPRKIKVLSNEIDEAPKTRAAGYGKVVSSMKKEINEAMDQIFLDGSDVLVNYLNNPDNRIPTTHILQLKPGESLSFEVKRNKIKYGGIRDTAGPIAYDDGNLKSFYNFSHNCLRFKEEGKLKPGEQSLIIVIEANPIDSKSLKIHAEQLEYSKPRKKGEAGALMIDGIFYHDKDVSDEKFQKIVGNSDNNNENKEGILKK